MTLVKMKILAGTLAASVLSVQACAEPQSLFANMQVQGFWLTEDGEAVVEITSCAETSDLLCGFISALPTADQDPELAKYADNLCGLPLLSNLSYNDQKERWEGGQIFDPESEQLYDVFILVDGATLKVRAFEGRESFGETLNWKPSEETRSGCQSVPQLGGS